MTCLWQLIVLCLHTCQNEENSLEFRGIPPPSNASFERTIVKYLSIYSFDENMLHAVLLLTERLLSGARSTGAYDHPTSDILTDNLRAYLRDDASRRSATKTVQSGAWTPCVRASIGAHQPQSGRVQSFGAIRQTRPTELVSTSVQVRRTAQETIVGEPEPGRHEFPASAVVGARGGRPGDNVGGHERCPIDRRYGVAEFDIADRTAAVAAPPRRVPRRLVADAERRVGCPVPVAGRRRLDLDAQRVAAAAGRYHVQRVVADPEVGCVARTTEAATE